MHPILSNYLISIPNGGLRSKITAYIIKKEGAKAGVSDLFLAYPNGEYHGCWLEMKAPASYAKLSIYQQKWLNSQNDLGYSIGVCYGVEEAMEYLNAYLSLDTEILSKYKESCYGKI